jgi:micrococcal nuclease
MKKNKKDFKNFLVYLMAGIVGILGGVWLMFDSNLMVDNQKQPAEIQTDCDVNLYKVSKVIDIDTIKLENGEKVRLIGVDGPENNECYFKESKQFLEDLLLNKYVRLEKDISGVDDYKRLLRYVILPKSNPEEDNILVNDYVVRNGQALSVSSAPDLRFRDLMASSQQIAMRENLGLWGECEYEPEYLKFREQGAEPPSENCIIKGNISERGYGKTYLLPGCDNYNTVKIDLKKGEQYFCTEKEAQEAGFRKATNCP